MARLQRSWFPQTDSGEISAAFLMPLGCDTFIVRCRRASDPHRKTSTTREGVLRPKLRGIVLGSGFYSSKAAARPPHSKLEIVSRASWAWYPRGIVQPK